MTGSRLQREVLSRPDTFPEEFKSWIARLITQITAKSGTVPITGGGGTTTSKKHLDILWQGSSPPSTSGAGGVWKIPQIAGIDVVYSVTIQTLFFATAPTSTYVVKTQKSTDGGSTWSDVQTCTVTAGNHEDTETVSGTVSSGDLLQIVWVTIGAGANIYTMQLEGDET